MSISHDSTSAANDALAFLRGKPNPFENLVRPQRPDDRFIDLHVPELLREPRELLLAVIDTFRLAEYRAVTDLPDSRVVTIRGRRGSGKTHLLETIAHRNDGRRQLVVRPLYFEPEVPFEKYLLDQLVNALLTDGPMYGGRPVDAIGVALTRRLLRLALTELGPVERVLLTAPAGWARRRLLWRGGEALASRVEGFLEELARPSKDNDLAAVARHHGFPPEVLVHLIEDYIQRWEKGNDALPAIRRQLYPALAHAALLKERDALTQFLEADYAPEGARPFHPTEILRELLVALIETCALVRLPVVFAFDNLEGLLAPRGQLDAKRVGALFDPLAHAVDFSRGLLFLLFAEDELYRSIRKEVNPFALTRIDQGVPVHGRVPVVDIELRPPNAQEMESLIASRIGRLLRGFSGLANLAPGFPFDKHFLFAEESRKELELRNKLMRLRDEYSRAVFDRPVPVAAPVQPPVDWSFELTRRWSERLVAASQELKKRALVTLYPNLHAGLRQLLQEAMPIQCDGLEIAGVHPMNTTHSHGTWRNVTVVDWRVPGSNGTTEPAVRVCVGLLAASNNAMPRDLEAKFFPLAETARKPDTVVVLWPAAPGKELPKATGQIWETESKKCRAVMHHISDEELHKLLALPEWVKDVRGNMEQPVPEQLVRNFLQYKCQALLSFVAPPSK